jgi:hypothetical protein
MRTPNWYGGKRNTTVRIVLGMLINGLGLVILIVLAVTVFMYTAPQIGQKPEGSDLARVS